MSTPKKKPAKAVVKKVTKAKVAKVTPAAEAGSQ
jgi:hypothetical protein